MIEFEADVYPPSMDEYLCERDVIVEYDFDDHGLMFSVNLRDADGTIENVDHLLSSEDERYFLSLIAEKEHKDYLNAQQELAEFEYDSRMMR